MKKTFYRLEHKAFGRRIRMALVADLHASDPKKAIDALREECPDYILLAGDILEALDGSFDAYNEKAMEIFSACASIAPTFYCTGNHEDGGVHSGSRKWKSGEGKERIYTKENLERINSSGVYFLPDRCVLKDGIAFGGLMSGLICKNGEPDLNFLREFAAAQAPKVLICHNPEYSEKYVKQLDIDLVVSGHAHGGQWRFFGRGVFAPGQGLFPKYTAGIYDNKLVVSRGLKKTTIPPRIFNPLEVVVIDVENK